MVAPVSAVFFSFLFQADSLKCFFALLNICGSGILFAFFLQSLVWRFPASTENVGQTAEMRIRMRNIGFKKENMFFALEDSSCSDWALDLTSRSSSLMSILWKFF